jgi:DNA-binding response OmpR family regulator
MGTTNSSAGFKAVLLVDDDRQLAESLAAALTSENFLVDVAHDGAEAFLKVKAHQYDAIVCDMMMPKLRGDQFYREAIQFNPALPAKFLFITGFVDDPDVRRFVTEVSARYLLKPFTVQELIDAVRRLTD